MGRSGSDGFRLWLWLWLWPGGGFGVAAGGLLGLAGGDLGEAGSFGLNDPALGREEGGPAQGGDSGLGGFVTGDRGGDQTGLETGIVADGEAILSGGTATALALAGLLGDRWTRGSDLGNGEREERGGDSLGCCAELLVASSGGGGGFGGFGC
jgi:hypothetical protein